MKIVPPKPFTFNGDNGRAVLLLHGFTGSTADVRMLGRFLQKNGYTTHAPMFPGHGVPPEQLLETGPDDWWKAVEEGYNHLREQGFEQIAVCGLSLGGLFTLKAGYTFKVNGIIPMCAPAITKEQDRRLYNGLLQYSEEYKRYEKKEEQTIEKEMNGVKKNTETVLTAIPQLIGTIREQLHEIKVPIEIIQAGQDEMVDIESANVIYDQVSSRQKHVQWYEDAPHVITLWKEKEKVHDHIVAFLEQLDWEGKE
ncbi:carboxylesterase [Salicibibacter halophilus]|uniref:Carboxylesterase n=1 Tax=Salicibibacter halophilus TaxID=2502791 RepID=A0A514LJ86_9BACI|nr:alpha/beta fold hydrolase [Salicibibacter halophilus]QDI91892.1 carboxylesterase [Salicibibacter halophilus]